MLLSTWRPRHLLSSLCLNVSLTTHPTRHQSPTFPGTVQPTVLFLVCLCPCVYAHPCAVLYACLWRHGVFFKRSSSFCLQRSLLKVFNCEYASQRGRAHSYAGVIKPEALHPRWSWNYWQLDLGPLKKHAFSHFAISPAPPSFLRLACDCWDLPVSIVQCWDSRRPHQAQHQLVLWI